VEAAGLTQREAQVLRLLARGATNHEIAAELHLSPDAIKKYASAVYRKLGVRNRTEAARRVTG
jgi:DNA-binding NarL/FixJ family response regulator